MRVLLAQVSLLPETLSRKVTSWQLPSLAARHGFQGVEWLDRLLPSLEPRVLRRLGETSREAGATDNALSLSIPCNAEPARLHRATQRCLRLLEACPSLGVSAVRVDLARSGINLGHLLELVSSLRSHKYQRGDPLGWAGRLAYLVLARAGLARDRGHGTTPPLAPRAELDRAVRALLPLAQKAAELGLTLGVENHWGLSGRQDQLLYTICQLQKYGVGVCLDLDNFYRDQDALAGVSALAPKAVHVHYKAHAREAEAEAARLDYRTRLGCLQRAGYAGMFSVEYDGPPPGLSGSTRAAGVLREMWEGHSDCGC
jgi:sugar phosphate isomerase/epimerase